MQYHRHMFLHHMQMADHFRILKQQHRHNRRLFHQYSQMEHHHRTHAHYHRSMMHQHGYQSDSSQHHHY